MRNLKKPMNDKLEKLKKTKSRSGRVSYGNPATIHESTKTRISFVPFYIPRSTGTTDLAVKIISEKKPTSKFPFYQYVEDKSISINEATARNLLSELQKHLKISEEEDGTYIVLKVVEGIADTGSYDTETISKAIAAILDKKDIVEHLASKELNTEMISAFRGAIRFREITSAINELKLNLNNNSNDEQIYQVWCQNHSWIFGNAYVVNDEKRQISTGDSVDLLLPNVLTGYRDIIELKRADKEVLLWDNSHKNYYFSSDVAQAIGQCHRYLDVLHESALNGLRDNKEIIAYHPRATIVIGRSMDWDIEKLKALHGLNQRLHSITIITYDQLVSQGERIIDAMSSEILDDSESDFEEETDKSDDDTIPF